MKRLVFIVALIAVGVFIYNMMNEEGGNSPPTPTTPLPETSTPTASVAQPSPLSQTPMQPNVVRSGPMTQMPGQPNVLPPGQPPAARPIAPPVIQPPPNPRAIEVRQIIYACAQRAGWRITNYQEPSYGVVRVTGIAPADNTRNQRFVEEIQGSGILRDFERGPTRSFTDPRGQLIMENTLIIKWQ
jgi:hypothetical protein